MELLCMEQEDYGPMIRINKLHMDHKKMNLSRS